MKYVLLVVLATVVSAENPVGRPKDWNDEEDGVWEPPYRLEPASNRKLKLSTFRHCNVNINPRTGVAQPYRMNVTGMAMTIDPVPRETNFTFTITGKLNGPPVVSGTTLSEGLMIIRQKNIPEEEIAKMRMQGHHIERVNRHQVAMRWQASESAMQPLASGAFTLHSAPSRVMKHAPTGRYRIRQMMTAKDPNPGEILSCIEIGFEVVDKMPPKSEIEAAGRRDASERKKKQDEREEAEQRRKHRGM